MKTITVAKTLSMIVSFLESKSYNKIYDLDMRKELSISDLSEFVNEYGGNITRPSDEKYEFDFYPIDGTSEFAIDYDLLVDGQRSYLTLQCQMLDDDSEEIYSFSINSIHIM